MIIVFLCFIGVAYMDWLQTKKASKRTRRLFLAVWGLFLIYEAVLVRFDWLPFTYLVVNFVFGWATPIFK